MCESGRNILAKHKKSHLKKNGKLIVSAMINPIFVPQMKKKHKVRSITEQSNIKVLKPVLSVEEKEKIRNDKYKAFVLEQTGGNVIVKNTMVLPKKRIINSSYAEIDGVLDQTISRTIKNSNALNAIRRLSECLIDFLRYHSPEVTSNSHHKW